MFEGGFLFADKRKPKGLSGGAGSGAKGRAVLSEHRPPLRPAPRPVPGAAASSEPAGGMRTAGLRRCLAPVLPAALPPSRGLCGRQPGGGGAAAAAARKITENAKKSLASLKRENPRLEPTLAIIQAHNDHLIQEINKNFAKEIVNEILRLNEDPNVQGLALDLPESLYSSKVLNAVKPEKDVDGLSDVNLGRLVRGDACDCLVPPTACAVMELLEDLGGKTVLLVGAGGAVGAALQCMLQREGAATLSCRWKAPQLQTKPTSRSRSLMGNTIGGLSRRQFETLHISLPSSW
ncbi:monofunctional C1-tetrahydrofolate synthase, mitochondrial-like [Mycteria americana]|uniref:monofunctional C1-tetrahydrofolate synthase, mitochondrial-like n=1 Tax=Mycteria americana TaxID=33587 RepID=UPI003F58FC6A